VNTYPNLNPIDPPVGIEFSGMSTLDSSLGVFSVVAPLLALCSCEWFVLLSCACDLLIFCPYLTSG